MQSCKKKKRKHGGIRNKNLCTHNGSPKVQTILMSITWYVGKYVAYLYCGILLSNTCYNMDGPQNIMISERRQTPKTA